MIRAQLLGRIAVFSGDEEIELSPKLRLLAAYLFWKQGEWVSRDILRGLFWGDSESEKAAQNCRTSLHRIRQALESAGDGHVMLARSDAVFVCDGDKCRVDARLFERSATEGLSSEAAGVGPLVTAVNLYRGEFLSGAEHLAACEDGWCPDERRRLAGIHEAVLRALVERLASSGLNHAAVGYALRWRDTDPLSEEVTRWLMRLYSAIGQPGRVTEEYDRCRDALEGELGVSLSDATVFEYKRTSRMARRLEERASAQSQPQPQSRMPSSMRVASDEPHRNAAMLLVSGESRVMHGDVDGGLEALNNALEMYRELGDEAGKARAQLVLAGALLIAPPGVGGADAMSHIAAALAFYRENGSPPDLARSLFVAAQAHAECSRLDRAVALASEGLEIAHSMGSRDTEARFMLILAIAYTGMYEFAKAREMFDALLADVWRLYQPPDISQAMIYRSALASAVGEVRSSEAFALEALAVAEQMPPSPRTAQAVHGIRFALMMIFHAQERREEMGEMRGSDDERGLDVPGQQYMEALLLMDGDDEGVLSSVQQWLRPTLPSLPPWWSDAYVRLLIEALLRCGRDREALRWTAVAIRRGRHSEGPYNEAYARCQRALCLARLGDTEAAAACALRAGELGEECPSNWIPAWLAHVDGLVALARSDAEHARELFAKSIELYELVGSPRMARLPAADLKRAGLD